MAAIKSKYFASKDVPVIVLDSGKPSKITADVKISGVFFTGNKSLSFTSFTGLSGKFSDIRQTVQRERREKRTQMDEIL